MAYRRASATVTVTELKPGEVGRVPDIIGSIVFFASGSSVAQACSNPDAPVAAERAE